MRSSMKRWILPRASAPPTRPKRVCRNLGRTPSPHAEKEPGWRAFLRQFRDPMQIVLLVAGAVSGIAIQQWGTAIVLFGLALLNAVMSLRQEGKAEASVAALQKMLLVKTRVRRGGETLQIPADQVVPGDIVLVEAGDRVPADGRLINAATLEIDESALTGESAPVPKQVDAVSGGGDAAGRPRGHGVHEHQCHAWLWRDPGHRDRYVHRGWAYLRTAAGDRSSKKRR